MKLLVVGGGGREHALAWKLAQSPRVQKVFVAPGNGGSASEPGVQNVAPSETAALIDLCRREQIQLTLVGPEAPLAAGVVDAFRDAGLRIFGPTRAAAQLESSKDFAKSFMVRHGLPTARHRSFDNARDARAYIAAERTPIVVKADGLAAGKGVVVAATREEANAGIQLPAGRPGDRAHPHAPEVRSARARRACARRYARARRGRMGPALRARRGARRRRLSGRAAQGRSHSRSARAGARLPRVPCRHAAR